MDNNMNELLQNLNTEQKLAVLATKGYVRILAGPGTGKTKVLTSRMVYLIQDCGVDAGNILSVTFTNKAANEMRDRVTKVLGYRLDSNICTFHGFCYRFLQTHIHLMDYPNNFMIMDGDYQLKVLREIYSTTDVTAHAIPPSEMLEYIAEMKSKIQYIPCETLLDLALDPREIKNEIFEKYLRKQWAAKMLDFDDLLHFTIHLLCRHADLLHYWQNKLQYIQVDEFQDVNQAQYDLVALLQDKHRNLFVVGDPDQTIYSWRGSNIRFINEFERKFHGAQTFLLTTNYRSSSSIIAVCNSLIKHNKNRIDKPLVPVTMSEGKVVHYQAKNIYDESHFIAESIWELKEVHKSEFKDIAILYRSSYITRQIEEALIQFHIPYTIIKGTAFYERQEIKDALAFLRLLAYEDDISFLRIINKPARGMGAMRRELLKRYAEHNNVSLLRGLMDHGGEPPFKFPGVIHFLSVFRDIKSRMKILSTADVLDEILNRTGYEKSLRHDANGDRIDNINELKQSLRQQETEAGGKLEITEYLSSIALYAEITEKQQPNSVQLMTVHAAKGLEYKYIIVCGLNEGRFPSAKVSSAEQMEEERRLAYVAFTRAIDGLILTNANGLDFKNIPLRPSRFLSEVAPGLIIKLKRDNNYLALAANSINL